MRPGARALLVSAALACTASLSSSRAAAPDLPASFVGSLPRRGCGGIDGQLDLWPDGVFHLRRVGRDPAGRDDELGRWRRAPDEDRLLLYGGREMPLSFAWRGATTLVPIDVAGQAPADPRLRLERRERFDPADLELGMRGMLRGPAGAVTFEECLTGRRYPVAREGDVAALEQAYEDAASGPDEPLLVSFEGALLPRQAVDREPETASLVVRRFIGAWPGGHCERAMADASLGDQYWRIVSLRGVRLTTTPNQREAHLVLHASRGRYAGSIGCDRFEGSYRVEGDRIRFEPATQLAAPANGSAAGACMSGDDVPGFDATLAPVLREAQHWKIVAHGLELLDAARHPLALFEAVYLR